MKLIVALCGGASLLAVAPAAFAQQAAPAAAPGAPAPSTLDTIVVTGSRIVRNGYAAPTPVTVASAVQLETLTPSNISDGLNKLPVFTGSTTSATVTGLQGNYLNLRQFGINRTLILIDGLRAAPTNDTNQVDVNTIPQMLLQRVDVVTGGASAVYGSDAVAGVVNYIMDNHFNGLKLEGQTGISRYGDAASARYGIAAGGQVLNLGHLEFSYEHFQEGGLLQTQRSWSAARPVTTGSGTAASPYVLFNNGTIGTQRTGGFTAFGGYVVTGPFAGQQFLANGQLGAYNPGTATNSGNIQSGGDGVYESGALLATPQNENQLYARFDRDLTSNISAFVDVSTNWSSVSVRNNNFPVQNVTIFANNPFLPASAQALLAPCAATTCKSFRVNLFPRDLQLLSVQTQANNDVSVTAGLKGNLFDNYKWELSYTHGVDILRQTKTNNVNYPKLYAALDVVPGPNGPVCNVSTGQFVGCAPLNAFGVGNESAAAEAFIFQTTSGRAVNSFDDYESSIAGSPFSNWAGPVSVALNAEYRQQSLVETTNADPNAPVDMTGIRDFNGAAPAQIYAYATQAPINAANSVWEISGETVVPLAKDMTFIKSLDVSGAVRYTDYSSSGAVETWKIGLDYQPIDDVRIRATASHDIRAPTLLDLYAGKSIAFNNLNDPHITAPGNSPNGVVAVISQGNPNLVPEVSMTTTVGIVYSPSWLPRFRMSVDYYDISMNNAITQLSGTNATILQQCEAAQWNAPLCAQLIVRPVGVPFSNNTSAAFPTAINQLSENIASQKTRGVDIEASYGLSLTDLSRQLSGAATFRLLYSYQPINSLINLPGTAAINAAGTMSTGTNGADPANRVSLIVGYNNGPFALDWQTRYSSALRRTSTPGLIFTGSNSVPDYYISDLNLTYRFKVDSHPMSVFFNIQNIFDAAPRISNSTQLSGIPGFGLPSPSTDDQYGRYFTAGFKFSY